MIKYELKCTADHRFEAWFKDSATYEAQAADGEVECPFCGDRAVTRAPMAPNVVTRRASAPADAQETRQAQQAVSANARGADAKLSEIEDQAQKLTYDDRSREIAQQIMKAVDKVREHIEDTFDYVGDKFADEARAIQSGDAEERPIYGEATKEEAAELEDEGIEPGKRVGTVGWKSYDVRENPHPPTCIEIPAYIVDILREAVGDRRASSSSGFARGM